MPIHRLLTHRLLHRICIVAVSWCAITPVAARDIHIAFVEDGLSEVAPALSELIVQELQPLLRSGDTVQPIFLGNKGSNSNVVAAAIQAQNDPRVDYIIATGFIGSQALYSEPKFNKPTYTLRVLDPGLTGAQVRDKVNNLRGYSNTNELVDVFNRLKTLFNAKTVGIALPTSAGDASRSVGSAVTSAAARFDIEVRFLSIDFKQDIAPQLADVDTIILPSSFGSDGELNRLLETLRKLKLPSYAVGGDSMVHQGALMSDTLDSDLRVLARRVALDLQLAIAGEARTRGMRWLEPKQRTTINMDTARAINFSFDLDELIAARIVQGNVSGLALGFSSTLELATERNLSLRGQQQQLAIDVETLEQARAGRRPQLSAAVTQNYRGEQLPERDTLGSISLSQTIYSSSANADVEASKLGLESSRKLLQQQRIDTVQSTARAYFQVLQTQAQFETSVRDLALNRENLELAETRAGSGGGTGADVYRWQAIIASSENALLKAYTSNTSAQSQLAQLLNTRLQIPTTLADVDLDQPPFDLLHEAITPYLQNIGRAELLREMTAARALSNSPELDSAAVNVAINEVNIKALKRAFYTPSLSLNGQYSHYLDSTDNSAGVELDGEHDWSVAINAELPLWLGGQRRSLLRQYRAQSALANTQLQTQRIALWASSGDVTDSLVANFRAIELSEKAESAALKSYEITQRAYKLGSASVTDLQDTQNSYLQAQDDAHVARYQYLTALVDFQALMGDMPMLKSGAEQQQWLHDFNSSLLPSTAQ